MTRIVLITLFFLAPMLSACGGSGGFDPGADFSGTVFAPPNGNVAGTELVACYRGVCEDARSRTLQLGGAGASAAYRFDDLDTVPYALAAFKDVNGNGKRDSGDYIGVTDASQVPPARVDLQLEVYTENGGGEVSIRGTLTAPADADVAGSVVVACYQNDCQDERSRSVSVIQAGASAPYSVGGLENGVTYGLLAFKDVNGNGEVSLADGDYLGQAGPVTAPAQNVAITLQAESGNSEGGAVFPDLEEGTNGDAPLLLNDADGTLHLLYTALTADARGGHPVRYGVCASGCDGAAAWTFTTVGDVGFWGGHGQLALSADGHPRVLYFGRNNLDEDGRFIYARCDGDCTDSVNWTREPLEVPRPIGYQLGDSPYFALAPDGTPAFVYIAQDGTYYAYRNGTGWDATRLSEGGLFNVSLAFTSGSQPRMVFHATSADNESYLAYLECSDATCRDDAFSRLPTGVGYAANAVLRLSPEDAPRILYYSGAALEYLWCDTSCAEAVNWNVAAVGTKEGEGEDGIDLVLDEAGKPHISYGDAFSIDLFYGFCSAACESTDPSWHTGLLVESSDQVRPEPPYPSCPPGETPASYWYAGNAPSLALEDGQPSFAYRVDNLQGCDGDLVGEGPSIVRFSSAHPTARQVASDPPRHERLQRLRR